MDTKMKRHSCLHLREFLEKESSALCNVGKKKHCKEQPKILNTFGIFNSLELLKITLKKKKDNCASLIYKQNEATQQNQVNLRNCIPSARLVFQLLLYLYA